MDKTVTTTPDFTRLILAVERIAGRENPTTTTTVLQARPLDDAAVKSAEAYAATAASLRTLFEPRATAL